MAHSIEDHPTPTTHTFEVPGVDGTHDLEIIRHAVTPTELGHAGYLEVRVDGVHVVLAGRFDDPHRQDDDHPAHVAYHIWVDGEYHYPDRMKVGDVGSPIPGTSGGAPSDPRGDRGPGGEGICPEDLFNCVAVDILGMADQTGRFVHAQVETCHVNDAGVAVYAYFRGEPDGKDWADALRANPDVFEPDPWAGREEVPTPLSVATGTRRYCLGGVA